MQSTKDFFREPIIIPENKKAYFASDFHLGAPDYSTSRTREDKIIRWLDSIRRDAAVLFLLGDQFDFWFEYKHVIPKGYVRFLGKLAELRDQGLPIYMFTGNHDMWMFDYLEHELDIPIIRQPVSLTLNQTSLHIGHGDGLGPGDRTYKILKLFFQSTTCQWLFRRLHPNLSMSIAHAWSKNSRIKNHKKDESFKGKEQEWIYLHCCDVEKKQHHNYYIFGHRHLPLNIPISDESVYVNTGEWISQFTYAEFTDDKLTLQSFAEG